MTLSSFRLFRRPGAAADDILGRPGKEMLHFPLPRFARIAVLDCDFRAAPTLRRFDSGDLPGLCAYAPDALVLPLAVALIFADRRLRGLLELPESTSVIVVLSSVDDSPLAEHHRDMLWKSFGLPVFEQLRGRDGRVFARECEVHAGLHFDPNGVRTELADGRLVVAGMQTGLTAEITQEECDCGATTPRLRQLTKARARAAAA